MQTVTTSCKFPASKYYSTASYHLLIGATFAYLHFPKLSTQPFYFWSVTSIGVLALIEFLYIPFRTRKVWKFEWDEKILGISPPGKSQLLFNRGRFSKVKVSKHWVVLHSRTKATQIKVPTEAFPNQLLEELRTEETSENQSVHTTPASAPR